HRLLVLAGVAGVRSDLVDVAQFNLHGKLLGWGCCFSRKKVSAERVPFPPPSPADAGPEGTIAPCHSGTSGGIAHVRPCWPRAWGGRVGPPGRTGRDVGQRGRRGGPIRFALGSGAGHAWLG